MINQTELTNYINTRNAWAEEDTPSYKILFKGLGTLTERELLMQIIGIADHDKAMKISTAIMAGCGNSLQVLSKKNVADLLAMKIEGFTKRMAITITAVCEIARRRLTSIAKDQEQITTSRQVFEILYPLIGDSDYEQFYIITLNRTNKVIRTHRISDGGLTGTIADPRKVMLCAIQDRATAVILSHNHPSGSVCPSSPDIELTKKMKEAGKVLDINIFDHVIIGGDKYYSFAEEGLI